MQLALLASSVALANLAAADRAGDRNADAAASLTRPDRPGRPLPGGEGWEASNQVPIGAEEFDAWHARFGARLDESLASLRAGGEQESVGELRVTRGRPVETDPEPTVAPMIDITREGHRFPVLAGILREKGLPPGLMGVVAVESGFDPMALSPKGARGLWQLMPGTARRYGLVVGAHRDERTDPVKSTHAAAAYMKDLFALFEDWPLALAAYNAGEERVARAMKRVGARDFWTLRRRAALPGETLRYVPAVLAKLEGPLISSEPAAAPPLAQGPAPRGQVVYAATTAR